MFSESSIKPTNQEKNSSNNCIKLGKAKKKKKINPRPKLELKSNR
jgi:hypothetical protein